jgi:hypothetical protein
VLVEHAKPSAGLLRFVVRVDNRLRRHLV